MATPAVSTIPIRHCNFEAKVKVGGSGPPVLYLHTAGGPLWDPFVEALAERHTVYAPDHPGTGDTVRESIYAVESLWDLVLIYDEILDALNLSSVPVVGASFGGMMACELAAHRPERVSKMVLLDPIGLWRDDAPVTQYMLLPPEKLMATLFKKFDAPPVQKFLQMPTDPKQLAVAHRRFDLGARGDRKVRVADSRQGAQKAPASRHRPHPDHLGGRRRAGLFDLRQGVCRTDRKLAR
jgi:pimeloyl-ACP methyl ester carboxylesterase